MLGEAFDPTAEFTIRETCKPHWSQAGAVVFLTMRLKDSIPRELIHRWDRQRRDWLRRAGVLAVGDDDWAAAVERLDADKADRFRQRFNTQREVTLDDGLGRCELGRPPIASAVAQSLLKFDGVRYRMGDFVIMPNHVHLLTVFASEEAMQRQRTAWMRYTARTLNPVMGRTGPWWQRDPFDHLVRSPTQYDYLRDYIRDDPTNAGLPADRYLYRRLPDGS